ncbi:MAG: methyltransferase domain-containing protein [Thermodesulfobacteriota bacterium]
MSVLISEDILNAVEPLKHFAVPKLLGKKVLRFVEEEGILRLITGLGTFSLDELCRGTEEYLGYTLKDPVRKRMVFSLLNILVETGYIKRTENRYCSTNGGRVDTPGFDIEDVERLKGFFDGETFFYSSCIQYTGNFLKGDPPLYSFDPKYGDVWETFLGNYEFSVARNILLQSLRVEDNPSFHILDLCYGRGHGLDLICRLYPRTKVTAIDFTDAFQNRAREKVEMAQMKNSSQGIDISPVKWVNPTEWKGFGDRLPFEDKTFDVVFFACGDPYIPPSVRKDVYRDIYRVLKPGGGLGIMTRGYPDLGDKYITNNWAKLAVYIHDFAEAVCENWYGFYGIEETIQMFTQLGFLPRAPFFDHFSILDYALWGLSRPANG